MESNGKMKATLESYFAVWKNKIIVILLSGLTYFIHDVVSDTKTAIHDLPLTVKAIEGDVKRLEELNGTLRQAINDNRTLITQNRMTLNEHVGQAHSIHERLNNDVKDLWKYHNALPSGTRR